MRKGNLLMILPCVVIVLAEWSKPGQLHFGFPYLAQLVEVFKQVPGGFAKTRDTTARNIEIAMAPVTVYTPKPSPDLSPSPEATAAPSPVPIPSPVVEPTVVAEASSTPSPAPSPSPAPVVPDGCKGSFGKGATEAQIAQFLAANPLNTWDLGQTKELLGEPTCQANEHTVLYIGSDLKQKLWVAVEEKNGRNMIVGYVYSPE